MKLIIFAGGAGTRLWPLSRKNSPKQFRPLFEGKSTIQLAVERIENPFGTDNIYVSTNDTYVKQLKQQLPQIPPEHIIGEPAKRNVAPAVGYSFIRLRKQGYQGPIAILWADQLMERVDNFVKVLKQGERLVKNNPEQLVFIGEKPRYAEDNLGWIHIGKKTGEGIYKFIEWSYKPDLEKCQQMFASGEWYWNPGYFIVNLGKILELYKQYFPQMYQQLLRIEEAIGTDREQTILAEIYPQLESVHFDRVIEKVPPEQAVVIPTELGWSDPGTLYAFKEAFVGQGDKNLVQGLAIQLDTKDSLIINEEKEKLVATVGLEGIMVVVTKDAILVAHKDHIVKISDLVKRMEEDEQLKKFT